MGVKTILLITGPSNSGQTYQRDEICETYGIPKSLSVTSRPREARDKPDAYADWISEMQFLMGVKDGLFLEHKKVHEAYYGRRFADMPEGFSIGQIDPQGAYDLATREILGYRIFVGAMTIMESTLRARNALRRQADGLEVDEGDLQKRVLSLKEHRPILQKLITLPNAYHVDGNRSKGDVTQDLHLAAERFGIPFSSFRG